MRLACEVIIGLDKGLAPNRRHVFIQTNDNLVRRRMHTALGEDELVSVETWRKIQWLFVYTLYMGMQAADDHPCILSNDNGGCWFIIIKKW